MREKTALEAWAKPSRLLARNPLTHIHTHTHAHKQHMQAERRIKIQSEYERNSE